MPPKGTKGTYHGRGPAGGTLKEVASTRDQPAKHNREFRFMKKTEANAFKQGVELVNDASIKVVDIRRRGTHFFVLVQDNDYQPDTALDQEPVGVS